MLHNKTRTSTPVYYYNFSQAQRRAWSSIVNRASEWESVMVSDPERQGNDGRGTTVLEYGEKTRT
jgi:hypothetical protein